MRIPFILSLVFLGLCQFLQGQQSFSTGETVELPSITIGSADHATLAINLYGDVFIANQGDHASGGKFVEGTAIASLGNHNYRTSATILLGDSSLGLTGSDTCRKPDVEALGDGSFVVVWPRNDRNQVLPARLEVARIVMRDANGTLLPVPEVHSAAPGEGYLIDGNIKTGDAGIMPDLVWLGDQDALGCAVVYVHEINISSVANKVFREYELRCTRLDWSHSPQSPQFLGGPFVLASPIPMDNLIADPYNGGLILPDVVLDDSDNLVVAIEEAIASPHLGFSGPIQNRIRILHFQSFSTVTPLQWIDSVLLVSPVTTHRPRRPNLSSSREDLSDSVSVAYGLQGLQGAASKIAYKTVNYIAGGVGGYRPPQDAYWIPDPQRTDGLPTVANNGAVRSCFAVRQYPAERKLLSSISRSNGLNTLDEVPTPILFPWRPSAKLVTFVTPGPSEDLSFAAICYEGDDTLTPSTYRVFFTYRQL